MMNKKIEQAINKQINREFYSAYLYLAMSAYCEEQLLAGFSKWLREQAKEELGHGMKLYELVHDRSGQVTLDGVEKPPRTFKSVQDVFQQVFKHEQEVTRMIESLYELAEREKDYATKIALQWFVTEQVEEEKTSSQMVEQLRMIGDQGNLLMLLDRQLAAAS